MRRYAHRSRLSSALAVAMLAGLSGSCQGPPVDARAIWLDRDGDTLNVYDRGQLRGERFEVAPVMGEAYPRAQLGPRGRLLVVRPGPDVVGGELWDLDTKRRWTLPLPPLRPGADDPVQLSPAGDALFWVGRTCAGTSCGVDALWVAPLSESFRNDPRAGSLEILAGGPVSPYARVLAASGAPVLVTAAQGELTAWRYPISSAPSGDGSRPSMELELLDRRATSFATSTLRETRCPFANWCQARAVISPQGGAAYFSVETEVCDSRLLHWAPGDPPSCEPLPEALEGASLLAALSADDLVFVSEARLFAYDRRARPMRSLPILGGGEFFTAPVDDGRALVFASFEGPVLRAEAGSVSIVSNAQTRCEAPDAPVVSPDGRWLAWACGRAPDIPLGEGFASALVRVHEGELERHTGVGVWPLAIDGDGDLLFVTTDAETEGDEFGDLPPLDGDEDGSTDAGVPWGEESGTGDDGGGDAGDGGEGGEPGGGIVGGPFGEPSELPPSPRTLYSLSREGIARRVSDMEPAPAPTQLAEAGAATYVQVGAD